MPQARTETKTATGSLAELLADGQRHHRAGRVREAERAYREILVRWPDQPDAQHYLGILLFQSGQGDVGLDLLRRSVAGAPSRAEFYDNLARALHDAGALDEAIEHYRQAIARGGATPQRLYNLGNALLAADRADEAITAYREAIGQQPEFPEAHNNLGAALEALGNARQDPGLLREAVAALTEAADLDPEFADAHDNLGNTYMDLHRHQAASEDTPADPADRNCGTFWPALAEAAYRRALDLDGGRPGTHANLGNALLDRGRLAEAIAAYDAALALDPDDAGAHWNRSQALLMLGRFDEGWREYEWRWAVGQSDARARHRHAPAWDGSPLAGRRVHVWPEQGVGDEIMFASMVPDLAAAGHCVLECDPRLVPLFARSFAGVEVIPKRPPSSSGPDDRGIDVQVPIGGLARWLRPSAASFPRHEGYLVADPAATEARRARYAALGDGAKIGISWRSGNAQVGGLRTAPLALWGPVLQQPGARFVNLQYGECAHDLREPRDRFGVTIHHDETVDALASIDDFAAQVAALDLVISIDNSTVHMAGALGRPVWTLLPAVPNWRWLTGREISPWYPSMRLFRQARARDWGEVIEQVAAALADLVRAPRFAG